jgi:O-phospho-L-seryl-tRNASec:L-selenocysteinyl-tRNA synthase
MNQLTNSLLLDLIRTVGIRSASKCILIPVATGLAITLTLLALRNKKKEAKYVLWSRIDQKSCFKCIQTANLTAIIIDPIRIDDELNTDIAEFENQIHKLGANNILAIISTSSCFAPRACDDLEALAFIAKKYNIFHVVNNAYGLQSTFLTHQIEQAQR